MVVDDGSIGMQCGLGIHRKPQNSEHTHIHARKTQLNPSYRASYSWFHLVLVSASLWHSQLCPELPFSRIFRISTCMCAGARVRVRIFFFVFFLKILYKLAYEWHYLFSDSLFRSFDFLSERGTNPAESAWFHFTKGDTWAQHIHRHAQTHRSNFQ